MKIKSRDIYIGTRDNGEKIYYSLKQIRNLNRADKKLLRIREDLTVSKWLKEESRK